jgi:ATP-dependent Clp protease ATP-binding subunit ClpA
MFAKLRRDRADLTTMNVLFPAAERIARDDGIDQPGAEHFLLAALDLPDGIAATALRNNGIEAADLQAAITAQHDQALHAIGIAADDSAINATLPSAERPKGLYRAQGSLQAAFHHSVALAKADNTSLNSGHVLLAVTEPEHGTIARALEHLGLDIALLRDTTRLLAAAH